MLKDLLEKVKTALMLNNAELIKYGVTHKMDVYVLKTMHQLINNAENAQMGQQQLLMVNHASVQAMIKYMILTITYVKIDALLTNNGLTINATVSLITVGGIKIVDNAQLFVMQTLINQAVSAEIKILTSIPKPMHVLHVLMVM